MANYALSEAEKKSLRYLIKSLNMSMKEFESAYISRGGGRSFQQALFLGRETSLSLYNAKRLREALGEFQTNADSVIIDSSTRDVCIKISRAIMERLINYVKQEDDTSFIYELLSNNERYGYVKNPATIESKENIVQEFKRTILGLMSKVSLQNDPDHAELRAELVAFLRAILAFLGDAAASPPKTIPRVIPQQANDISERLKNAASTTKAMKDIYDQVIYLLSQLFG
ncbi:hypothetical protein [Mesorhizobium sp. GbtcB19]|uniref:hypothetical protein n=1 Tax=Mesorhizobium sp. GbtcB19 TaxID=2824764 RepID=UPI001C2F8299|nr:hypothetical protein [Mesorhizobium sp. GbtcB19]